LFKILAFAVNICANGPAIKGGRALINSPMGCFSEGASLPREQVTWRSHPATGPGALAGI